jgi:hypothetical protein
MDRYKDYIVEFEIGAKKFRGKIRAFNEDNVKMLVRKKIIFTSITECEEPKNNRADFGWLFNEFFK